MFVNTQGKGFQITFGNGFSVSVQWGPGNYCDNHMSSISTWAQTPAADWMIKSRTAEVAVRKPDGELAYIPAWSDSVKGWCDTNEVLALMIEVAAYPPDLKMPDRPAYDEE